MIEKINVKKAIFSGFDIALKNYWKLIFNYFASIFILIILWMVFAFLPIFIFIQNYFINNYENIDFNSISEAESFHEIIDTLSIFPPSFYINAGLFILFLLIIWIIVFSPLQLLFLNINKGKETSLIQCIKYCFKDYLWFKLILLNLLLILLFSLGALFFVIPGIYLAIVLSLSNIIILDKNIGVIASLKLSRKLVHEKISFWKLLFVYFIYLITRITLSSIFEFVNLDYSIMTIFDLLIEPFIMMAIVEIYRQAENKNDVLISE